MTSTVRLHITPFNQTIFDKNIPTAIRNAATKVSFHAVQTFPEKGFGYLEVTRTDAEAIKRKLNGSMLKGIKIRIEEAKPMKRKAGVDAEGTNEDVERAEKRVKREKAAKKEKKSGKDVVLQAYELPADRKVKRGWTEDTKSASKKSSKVESKPAKTSKQQVLFKTIVPPNATELSSKDKSDKRKEKSKDKKTKSRKGEVVVKEFQHSRNTFVVSSSITAAQKPAVAYEDGLGWVDEDGNVVQGETAQAKRRRQLQVDVQPEQTRESSVNSTFTVQKSLPITEARAEASTSEDSELEEDNKDALSSQSSSSSESSSADDSSDEESDEDDTASTSDVQPNANEPEVLPDAAGEDELTTVHPLEALYKRPKSDEKTPALTLPPINTSFSFFGAAEEDEDEPANVTLTNAPHTPHTKQDFEWRNLRSAAPTPDTAAIEGRFSFPFGPSDDEKDIATGTPLPAVSQPSQATTQSEDAQPESAFRKFFFEKRGDNDRAWKKKRREARKLQRQRENRRLTRRIV